MFELCDILNIRLDDLFQLYKLCLHVSKSSLDHVYLFVQLSDLSFTFF